MQNTEEKSIDIINDLISEIDNLKNLGIQNTIFNSWREKVKITVQRICDVERKEEFNRINYYSLDLTQKITRNYQAEIEGYNLGLEKVKAFLMGLVFEIKNWGLENNKKDNLHNNSTNISVNVNQQQTQQQINNNSDEIIKKLIEYIERQDLPKDKKDTLIDWVKENGVGIAGIIASFFTS